MIWMIHSHVSISALVAYWRHLSYEYDHRPLQVVRSGILVLSLRAKWAEVARRTVNKTVSDHLILPFEPFATFTPRAVLHGTVVWPDLAVNVFMRTVMWNQKSEGFFSAVYSL